MIATIEPRSGLNFPAATAADWQRARRTLIAFLVRRDVDPGRAEEITQETLTDLLTRTWSDRSPVNPQVAVSWRIATAKRYGVKALTREGKRHSERRRRTGVEEPQPVHVFEGTQDRAPGWTDPARMAAEGEALADRMPRLAARARKDGTTPAGLALRACGWGWPDEGGNVPSVTDCGPGYTPPDRGCRGLHDTDPNPATRAAAYDAAAADAARVGLALTRETADERLTRLWSR
jgi:hypothetical protein